MARPSAVAERRREILEATCEVVSERGFRDLRIVDVAKEAGYSTGTVHYYFDSKEELLREAFRFEYEKSRIRREAVVSPGLDPVARLRALADAYLPSSPASVRSWRVWMELWISALRDPSMGQVNDVYYGEWRQAVLDAMREGQEKGLIEVPDPQLFANMYVSMMDGLAIQVLAGAEGISLADMQATCRAFVDSVAVTS
ncbi:TetR/AcrR family transcriptional regulator [Nocardioides sp. LHD-245]|uniref:TetR/AcrR family transcriptional regulator n=1 Tax=Nocardioides sp. LHD-245 TaxID=3051387 RepID=UPI0027E00396|nr:TetR/AcrR family transcriptional regulator [Nocardioides sp. LHD-245]